MLNTRRSEWLLGFVLPVALVAVILTADALEGPKTAFVGVLAVVPMLAAVFARPRITAAVGVIAWLAALWFGTVASDGNVAAQKVRLVIIALSGIVAVWAASLRDTRARDLVQAQREAAIAEHEAVSDALTGLLNRRGIVGALDTAGEPEARAIALMDCDNLKDINDEYGHGAGDDYLRAIGGRVRANLHSTDLVARWGGDEFLIVLDLPLDLAAATLNRLREAISADVVGVPGGTVAGSVSVGLAPWTKGATFDEVLASADRALYRAKSQGRNQIQIAE